jgi:hypothetical protein
MKSGDEGRGAAGGSASDRKDRKARLADELRANLARRKAQARSRRISGADERPEGLEVGGMPGGGKVPGKPTETDGDG